MHKTIRTQGSTSKSTLLYLTIWILASIGGGLFFYNIYKSIVTKEINITKEIATREVLSANSFCNSIFISTENNIKLISKGQYLKSFIKTMQPYQIEDTDKSERKDLLQFLTQLLSANPRYNSIRFISFDGRERIKVINTDNGPKITPPQELRNISDYYYVKECLQLPAESIYYSHIDLQRNVSSIDFPFKPTLRIGKSVYSHLGKLKGMIVINLSIDFSFPPHLSLLSKKGDWVIGGGENWMNFIFAKVDNFATIHPEIWKDVSSKEFGSIIHNNNFYEFTTLTPPSAGEDVYWKILSEHPKISHIGDTHIVDYTPILLLFIAYELTLTAIIIFSYKRQTKLFNYQQIIETNLEHYDISLKAGHAMSWIYTPDTRVLNCSQHIEELIGLPADKFTTENDFIELFTRSTSSNVKSFFDFLNAKDFDESQNEFSIEHVVPLPHGSRHKQNRDIWLNTYAIRLKNNDDSYTIYGISFDITNRVLLEQSSINSRKASEQLSIELQNLLDESERLRIKAEQASSAKADFLANISHEIRTPMNSVLGMVSLLLETSLTTEQKDYISAVKHSGEALLLIINDILDHSKIESGKLEILEVPFNIFHTVEHIIDMIAPQAEKNFIKVSHNIDDRISTSLIGDDLRLTQILLNLAGNAIKFTSSGSIEIALKEIDNTDSHSIIEIKVSDTGIGIAQDALEDIFDKFTQADASTTRKFGGTGLGLSICKSLVELMNGSISVESMVGVSTTFTIILPLKKHCPINSNLEDSLAGKKSIFNIDHNFTYKFTKASILLCEDNEMNQNLCIKFLNKFDSTADIAENGLVAIDKFLEKKYDLILMDLQMPELDGISTVKRIRKIEKEQGLPTTPIIAVTANVFEDNKKACNEAGMNGFLSKPISLNEFKNTIHNFLPNELQVIIPNAPELGEDIVDTEEQTMELDLKETNTPTTSVIDYKAGIANSGGEDNYNTMIELFINDTLQIVEDIHSAATKNQHSDASRHSHTLKSMAAIVGASTLNKYSFDGEHSKDCEDLLAIFPDIKKQAELAISELSAHLNKNTSEIEKPQKPSPITNNIMKVAQQRVLLNRDLGVNNSGGEENFLDMIEIFKKEVMTIIQNIEFESLNGNTTTTFRNIHTLKCMANIIGANELANICIESEGSKDCYVIQQILPIIQEEVNSVLQEISKITK